MNTQPIEITQDIAQYFNSAALVESPQRVYRIDHRGMRLYYTFNEAEEITFYFSVTTMLKQVMPTSPFLIEWTANMGVDEAHEYMMFRAAYGTFMHAETAALTLSRRTDLDAMQQRLKDYIEVENLKPEAFNWYDDLCSDVLAWAQFMIDYDYKPYAIEILLAHPDGFGGALDDVGSITHEVSGFWGAETKDGRPKKTKKLITEDAIIDKKSGRKGFYSSAEAQLALYRRSWNYNFQKRQINKIFNWSPKAWTGMTPTYNFKDQTDTIEEQCLDSYIQIAKVKTRFNDIKPFKILGGEVDISEGVSRNIELIEVSSIIKEYHDRQD